MAGPVFNDVKTLLDTIISDWKAANDGNDPDLFGAHDTNHFSWLSKAELLASEAKGLKLVQPEVIGQTPGRGKDANIVIALKEGVNDYPQMPDGGPYRTNTEIQVIIDWIDAGCPE